MKLIGRQKETATIKGFMDSGKSEFLVVYGRRRVGKTFLIRTVFENQFDFCITGLAEGNSVPQLSNFAATFQQYFSAEIPVPANWLTAFDLLIKELEKKEGKEKHVIFIDEMPWLATPKSDFMIGLAYFWNTWASAKNNIFLIVAGAAASFTLNEWTRNAGGSYNRLPEIIRLEPFNLQETEDFLSHKNISFDRNQIALLYMTMGGVPFYLAQIEKGKSAMQNVEDLFFRNEGKLRTEFNYIFSALFKHTEKHDIILKTIFNKGRALSREETIKYSTLCSGGAVARAFMELEENGFITSFPKFGAKNAILSYAITDLFTLFYLHFLQKEEKYQANIWLNKIDSPAFKAWVELAFEQLCFAHTPQIEQVLQIDEVESNVHVWLPKEEAYVKGSQRGLLIERSDNVINLFETKFSLPQISIDSTYNKVLMNKIQAFKAVARTKKTIFLTTITVSGISPNDYSQVIVKNELTLADLFDK